MLSGIIRLLNERLGALSVQEISLALDIESSALRPMLELLESKGRVEKVEIPCGKSCAGGCTESDTMTFYKVKRTD
ncbi:FeoC-like transcriptional regulator [Pontiella agarivorans]|uniref:FeoC-like transcriptional regulator n=1 Tax=Pontiella agarivorans TaxID=3038953 RepID=A0ABU5MY46_9BACT|nr:FeoC-like transcriptional regulator [Pontiella agarivorans]MDZ8118901.1 FeoC-like transcriptional regulator [Pontiella agarivorans]